MQDTKDILRAENLTKTYGKRTVVNNVSIELSPKKVVGLLGPNGAGKTTVFYMMVGLIYPNAGRIFIKDSDVTQQPLYQRARLGLGYLPQEPSLFKKLSVFDNLAIAFEAMGYSGLQLKERVERLLERFGLQNLAYNTAETLSGGERRRCEIARCLAINPKFVLLDEPFAGIDPIAVSEIQQFIVELKEQGIGVLITDHNVRETLGSCDFGYLMREGEIFFAGTPNEITQNPEAKKYYLGHSFRLN